MPESDLKPLPTCFDPQLLAERQTALYGWIASKTMRRLQGHVLSIEPMVIAKLKFSRGLFDYPFVTGKAHAKITVRCERCLEEVETSLDPQIEVLIKPLKDRQQSAAEGTVESPDVHEYDGKMLVLSELVEEELLLAMTLISKHEDISLCNQDMVAWLAPRGEADEADAGRTPNPFAILKR